MRILLFFATMMLISITAFSQNKLSALYSIDQLEKLKTSNPEVLEYWNIYLNKGWVIDSAKEDTDVTSTIELGSRTLDVDNFNPIEYYIYPKEQTQYIAFSSSEKILIIYPKSHIIYHYNKSKKQ